MALRYADVIKDIFFFENADYIGFKVASTISLITLEVEATLKEVKFQYSSQDLTSFIGVPFRGWSPCLWDNLPNEIRQTFGVPHQEQDLPCLGLKISTYTQGDLYLVVGRRQPHDDDKMLTVGISEKNTTTNYIAPYYCLYI